MSRMTKPSRGPAFLFAVGAALLPLLASAGSSYLVSAPAVVPSIVAPVTAAKVLARPAPERAKPQARADEQVVASRAAETVRSGDFVSFRVSDDVFAATLLANGGRLVADYDSFQVIDAPEVTARMLAQSTGAELEQEDAHILLNSGAINTRTAPRGELISAASDPGGSRMHMVHFRGPIRPEWYESLVATGVQVVTYIPNNSYLVYGESATIGRVQRLAREHKAIDWDGAYGVEHKLQPKYTQRESSVVAQARPEDLYAVQLVKDARENGTTLNLIASQRTAPTTNQYEILNYLNVIVALPEAAIRGIASRPDVVSVEPYLIPEKFDERQDLIVSGQLNGVNPTVMDYLDWLAGKGFTQAQFTASNFAVDVTDSGVDIANPAAPNHFALYTGGTIAPGGSRFIYSRLEGTPHAGSTIQGCDGHGNINAHIIAGFSDRSAAPHADASGFRYGLGVAPFVKVGSSVIFDPSTFTSPNYPNLQARAYRDSARISSNSWGANTNTYTTDAQAYDALVRDAQPATSAEPTAGNQEMVILFAAGNSGSGANTVGSPGTGKNVITVGASENVQAFGGADQCGTTDAEANSAMDIVGFSSRGNASDGRKKPEIMAPGTHVSGGVAQQSAVDTGTGDDLACFDATGVCAGPGSSNFFPTTQQFYTASSGTSHSTPAVAGGAALLRQWFINNGRPVPSPAMTKALLMSTARYMTGTGANDTLWSSNQGMGLMDLSHALDETLARTYRDQDAIDMFTATGQSRIFTGTVADTSKPVRITLAWTDAPGATSGSAWKNNLDMVVSLNGTDYKGNVFSGANSTTGGTADAANNVESVFFPAGTSGSVIITITATNINSDGVPNNANALDQDFALVASNVSQAEIPSIAISGSTMTAESCVPPNTKADPAETVTFDFTLQNFGTADANDVTATLLATGGVAAPSAAQNYGALLEGGSGVTRPFTFTVAANCGSLVTASLLIMDGATELGTVTVAIPTGLNSTTALQSFDAVAAPALPAGWSSTKTTGLAADPLWVTTTTNADTAPNAVFAPDLNHNYLVNLVSPSIAVPSTPSTISFRNRYNTENEWDGGVLDLSTDGGTTWTDIITAGGSWVSNGYNATLRSANPLGARPGFTGNSGGYLNTVVNLPASALGTNILLRWRMASDSTVAVASGGWWVDGLAISTLTCCTTAGAGTISLAGSTLSVSEGGGSAALTMVRTGGATGSVSVDIATTDGTATAGSDYTAASTTASFANGEVVKVVNVAIANDNVDESDETFTAAISNPTGGAVLGSTTSTTVTITDNDTAALSIADVPITEGDAGTSTASVTVTLSAAFATNVTVDYTTVAGTAVAANDFAAKSGTLTFVPGDVSETISIDILGDVVSEPTQAFTVVLSNASVPITDASATVTISDTDPLPQLVIGDTSIIEGNSGTSEGTIDVLLLAATEHAVSATYTLSSGTAVSPGDFTAETGTVNFAPMQTGQTIDYSVVGELTYEPNESFSATLTAPANATIADGIAIVSITNDDVKPTVSVANITQTEGNAGNTVFTFTVSLSHGSYQAISVDYTTADGTASSSSDYTSEAATLNFAPFETSKPVTIDVTGDTLYEVNETFLLNLSNAVNSTLGASAVATITDDETISILPTSGHSAGGAIITLSGSGGFTGADTVTVGGVPAIVTGTTPTSITFIAPALAPGTLKDVVLTTASGAKTLVKGYMSDFLDVPQGGFHNFIESIFRFGVTAGCGGGNFCPDNSVTREQIAVFLLVAKEGTGYVPPAPSGVFNDVPIASPFAKWIEELFARGITSGCGGGNYCPANAVTRRQIAVLLLVTKEGNGYVPDPAIGLFNDVPQADPFAKWIEELADRGITGGCGGGNFCPDNPVTRGQMAVFLKVTFALP